MSRSVAGEAGIISYFWLHPSVGLGHAKRLDNKGAGLRFRLPIAIIVFLGSYLPLSLILLAQDYDCVTIGRSSCWDIFVANYGFVLPLRNPTYSAGIFVVCLMCFVLTLAVLALVPAKRPIVIREARYVPAELMNYTLPYVVSFMGINYQQTQKFVGILIFLAWMFWITFKSGQIMLNPLLIAFGWKFYHVSYRFPGDKQEHIGVALADHVITSGQRCSHNAIQDVLIIKTKTEKE